MVMPLALIASGDGLKTEVTMFDIKLEALK